MQPMLMYIHIPFCDSKCHYCSFNSYVDKFSLRRDYMAALLRQLHFEIIRLNPAPCSIETLFIGGGTPSTVAAELYTPLFDLLRPYFAQDVEITSEANPNSASREWLQGMAAMGVNRISFGVQSFDTEKLIKLGRAHTSMQAIEAVNTAYELGIEHLSIDLIYATAGDSKTLLEQDVQQAFSLPIDHLSAYALTIEEGTPFASTPEIAEEKLTLTSWLFDTIISRGFEQYEISNFGHYRSRHNLGYWEYKPYIGLGAGAVGCIDHQRYYPHTAIEAYIADPLFRTVEPLDAAAVKTEKLFLGARSAVGIDETLLNAAEQERAGWLSDEGKLYYKNGRFYNRDYLLSDEIVLYLQG